MKITFLTVMPSPYIQDLFCAMAADPRIDLRVLYMEQVAPDTYWGEQAMPEYAKVLPGRWIGFSGARIHINPTVRQELDAHPADLVIIVGYVGLTNQIAIRHLNRQGRAWAFWGEVPGLHKRGMVGSWLRSMAQKPLRHTRGIAAVGSHAVEAYRRILHQLNATDRVHNIPYHCDIATYAEASKHRQPGDVVRFLYCGQLIERKGVDLLCTAFERLIKEGTSAQLTFAGEGPLRQDLAERLSPEVARHVDFRGFVEVAQLPEVFKDHDVFILPSRHDGWGVVVNQAIGAGMPAIVTSAVGAGNDLVVDGENGFVIPTEDSHAIYESLRKLASDRALVRQFGTASAERAEKISLPAAVADWFAFFLDCLQPAGQPS
ncbi:MAG: glycosyltransferase family 4 protein [Planctomycetaceae bacterium]|nr:glycosyltransferase family 4 protein [Planctomycetaceae bacterium]